MPDWIMVLSLVVAAFAAGFCIAMAIVAAREGS